MNHLYALSISFSLKISQSERVLEYSYAAAFLFNVAKRLGQFVKTFKIQVKLILNLPHAHAIAYTWQIDTISTVGLYSDNAHMT